MDIKKAAAEMGRKGGKSGTGEKKRRSREHYSQIAKLGWKYKSKPMPERFWSRVEKRGPDECWPWIGSKYISGYGSFLINGKAFRSHRIAYEIHNGVKAIGCILHRCDNPICCNPNHLFEGTQRDNMDDKVKKGRVSCLRGEQSGMHKLTEMDVLEIRNDIRCHRVIAASYGVTKSTIAHVKSRRSWKHV